MIRLRFCPQVLHLSLQSNSFVPFMSIKHWGSSLSLVASGPRDLRCLLLSDGASSVIRTCLSGMGLRFPHALNISICFLFRLLPTPLALYQFMPPGCRLGPHALLSLPTCPLGGPVDSMSIYTRSDPSSLSLALTFHPLFSPIFLNVYKIYRLGISLPPKTNMTKPDFIISPQEAASAG